MSEKAIPQRKSIAMGNNPKVKVGGPTAGFKKGGSVKKGSSKSNC